RIGPGWNGELDRAIQGRHAHLRPEHRLIERNRKLEAQIGAFARKQGMRRDRHRDQQIASASAGARRALPFQSNSLSVMETRRDPDVDLLARGQLDALLRTRRRLGQADGQRRRDVPRAASELLLLELKSAARSARATSKGLLQDILKAPETAKSTPS